MLIVVLFVVVMIVLYMSVKEQREQESRDRYFKRIMLELEEKAKREGTFVKSYFDDK